GWEDGNLAVNHFAAAGATFSIGGWAAPNAIAWAGMGNDFQISVVGRINKATGNIILGTNTLTSRGTTDAYIAKVRGVPPFAIVQNPSSRIVSPGTSVTFDLRAVSGD